MDLVLGLISPFRYQVVLDDLAAEHQSGSQVAGIDVQRLVQTCLGISIGSWRIYSCPPSVNVILVSDLRSGTRQDLYSRLCWFCFGIGQGQVERWD